MKPRNGCTEGNKPLSLEEIKQRNIQFFSRVQLKFYEIHSNPLIEKLNRIMVARFVRFLRLVPREAFAKAHILDAGCNDGYFFDYYYMKGAARVVGCDLSFDALKRGKGRPYGLLRDTGRNTPKRFVQGDLEVLPIAEASFDLILCFGTWHHIIRKEVFLQECLRVLRPGGMLVLSDPNDEHPLRRATDWFGRKIGQLMREERPVAAQLSSDLLSEQGFVDVRVSLFNVFSEMIARLCTALLEKSQVLYFPFAVLFLLSLPLDWMLEKTCMPFMPRRVGWTYMICARKPLAGR